MTNKILTDFLTEVTKPLRKNPPPADKFNPEIHTHGVAAGNNKFGAIICQTCGKPPSKDSPAGNAEPGGLFLFRDHLSAKEYRISAMCQACQDTVFKDD